MENESNLVKSNYEDMLKIATELAQSGNYLAAQIVVEQMVNKWPERVLNGKRDNPNGENQVEQKS